MGFFDNGSDYDAARTAGQMAGARYGTLGNQLGGQADYLRRRQSGQDSVSAEQLRQANMQTLAQQQSMAAGASPQNATMAALQASQNAMRASSGLAGAQAQAGLQERQGAGDALTRMLLQQREQEQRQQQWGASMAASQPTWWDKFGGAAKGAVQLGAMV